MLSDQMNGTFRRMQRGGMGNSMLGPMLQQGMFARTAPITQRFNANRAVNAQAGRGFSPGTGFQGQEPGMFGRGGGFAHGFQAPQQAQAMAPQQGAPGQMHPLLAQLGMLLMAQQGQRPQGGMAR